VTVSNLWDGREAYRFLLDPTAFPVEACWLDVAVFHPNAVFHPTAVFHPNAVFLPAAVFHPNAVFLPTAVFHPNAVSHPKAVFPLMDGSGVCWMNEAVLHPRDNKEALDLTAVAAFPSRIVSREVYKFPLDLTAFSYLSEDEFHHENPPKC
jgi:hypothetical protein